MIVTTDAVVLNTRKYGDTSKIVSLFTKEQGKVSIIAKGARRRKNKFGSSLEPLSCISTTYYFKPGRDLQTVSDAEMLFPVRKIHDSIAHLTFGLSVLESVSQTMPPLEENSEIYELLKTFIINLNPLPSEPFSYFVKSQLELASLLGFGMDFKSSGAGIGGKKIFSIENGAVSGEITKAQNNIIYLDEIILEKFIILINMEFVNVSKVAFDKKDEALIINFFKKYFGYHLERKFSYRSLSLINTF